MVHADKYSMEYYRNRLSGVTWSHAGVTPQQMIRASIRRRHK